MQTNKGRWICAWIAITPIAIVSCAREVRSLPKHQSARISATMHIVESDEEYSAIDHSDFAIVFVNTPWSATATFARKGFADFVLSNALAGQRINADYFVVSDESDELFTKWIHRFDHDVIGPLHVAPMGAGSVLWLKRGKLVDFQINTSEFSENDFAERTEKAFMRTVR